MSSNPRISFNKPSQNPSNIHPANPYNQNNSNIPPMHQSNFYEVRQASVIQSNASPVDLNQKPSTVFVGRALPVQEHPKSQYEQSYNMNAPSKRLGPQSDPIPKDTCCTPVWLYIAMFVGLTGLILSLLFGLRVIGGPVITQRVSSIAVTPNKTQTTKTTSTTYYTSSSGALRSTPTSLSDANRAYTTGTFVPSSIPAQTITTTTVTSTAHHKVSKPQDSFEPVGLSTRYRHKLPIDQVKQNQ